MLNQRSAKVDIPEEESSGFDAPIVTAPTKIVERDRVLSGKELDAQLLKMADSATDEFEEKLIAEGDAEFAATQQEYADEQKEAKSIIPKTPDQIRIEKLEAALSMLAEKVQTQSFAQQGSHEIIWAQAMADNKKHVEVDEAAWKGLTVYHKGKDKYMWWKDVCFHAPGTMEGNFAHMNLHVDTLRGMPPKVSKQTIVGRT